MVPLVCSSKLSKVFCLVKDPGEPKSVLKYELFYPLLLVKIEQSSAIHFLKSRFLNFLKVTVKDRNLLQVLMTASGPTCFGRQQSEVSLLSSILHPDSASELTRSRVRTCWGGGCPGWATGTDIAQTVRHSQGTHNQKTRLKNTEYIRNTYISILTRF